MAKPVKSPYTPPNEVAERRYSKDELHLFKVFKGNLIALKLLRKVFWQEDLDEGEQQILSNIFKGNKALLEVLRKDFDPQLNHREPIFGMAWKWFNPHFQDMLTDEVKPLVLGRQDSIRFIQQGLKRLENLSNGDSSALECLVDIHMTRDYSQSTASEIKRSGVAVQESLAQVESRIMSIQAMANEEELSDEDRAEKEKKDSME